MANMTLTKTPMPEQDPKVRARNFEEVALGYTAEQAMEEAGRCLGCKKPKCVEGCPVNVRIPEFIAKVAEGDFKAAYEIITSTNALPALSGRVCPQESQCECKCVRGGKGEPTGTGKTSTPCQRRPLPTASRLPWWAPALPASLVPPIWPRRAMPSPCLRRCTLPAACWSTASLSSVCPRPSWPTRSRSWRPRAWKS